MKTHLIFYAGWLLTSFFSTSASGQASQGQTDNWYNSRSWLHGLQRKPSETINKTEFAKQYQEHKAWWDSAFSYLQNTDLASIKPGRYTVYGNDDVYALVTEITSKNKEDALFEAHKNYADIHCVIDGKEMIGIAPYASAVEKQQYDPAKDIAFYTSTAGKYYMSDASTLFMMFPEKDAHCGGIKTQDPATVKKIVLKIRASK